jgi:hypothetical protein
MRSNTGTDVPFVRRELSAEASRVALRAPHVREIILGDVVAMPGVVAFRVAPLVDSAALLVVLPEHRSGFIVAPVAHEQERVVRVSDPRVRFCDPPFSSVPQGVLDALVSVVRFVQYANGVAFMSPAIRARMLFRTGIRP